MFSHPSTGRPESFPLFCCYRQGFNKDAFFYCCHCVFSIVSVSFCYLQHTTSKPSGMKQITISSRFCRSAIWAGFGPILPSAALTRATEVGCHLSRSWIIPDTHPPVGSSAADQPSCLERPPVLQEASQRSFMFSCRAPGSQHISREQAQSSGTSQFFSLR